MKIVTILSLFLLTSPAFSELTKEDIRSIIKEENATLEKRMKEYIDLKIDGVEKSLNTKIDATHARIDELDEKLSERIRDIWLVVLGLIALIVATVAIPQLIIAYKERGQQEMERRQQEMQSQIQQLNEKLEAMQSAPQRET